MLTYEYCTLVFNLAKGSAKVTYLKANGQHVEDEFYGKSRPQFEDQSIIRGQIIAELGDVGWLMCGTTSSNTYFFAREKR
ncbi:MAG: hypothetical protein ABI690_07605 [Chloroflexota bacterium]